MIFTPLYGGQQHWYLYPTTKAGFAIRLDLGLQCSKINCELGASRAHFDGGAHIFRTCALDVCTLFHLIIIAIYQRSAWKKSRVHSFKMYAPEGRTNYKFNFKQWLANLAN